MAEISVLKTPEVALDENIRQTVDKIVAHVDEGKVAGIMVGIIFRDGKSVTFGSAALTRLLLLGLLTDMLFDYQKGA